MIKFEYDIKRDEQFHKTYMKIALLIAELSYCTKRKVGAVIVKGRNILAYGFNGQVSGMPNVCEDDGGQGKDIHAEVNAILKAGTECEGANMYSTTYPCEPCARLMAQAGIKKVYYITEHNNCGQVELYGMTAIKLEL